MSVPYASSNADAASIRSGLPVIKGSKGSHGSTADFTAGERARHTAPIFHPQLRRTKEVIRRPEWVKHAGEGVAHRGSLNVFAVTGLLFANCVGGGYGFEDGIGSGGPLITLIVCLLLPWIWAFPTGLAVAELSTAVPSNSGVLMWTNAAFPPFISFLCIIVTIFITFIGNATYPSLTSEYASNLNPDHPLNKGEQAGIKIGVITLCCVLNCIGVEMVGTACIALCVITVLPFSLLTLIQLFAHGFRISIFDMTVTGWKWMPDFFSIISWNYANIENAGAVVEEIANPRKTLPLAMVFLMFGTYIGYVMPMLAGISAMTVDSEGKLLPAPRDYSRWEAGHWPEVGLVIAGPWLKYLLFAGAMLSGFGFTLTSMCCTSRLLAGMGTMEMFPKKISRFIGYYHPRLGTPIPAVVLNAVVTAVFCCTLEFGSVVALCQVLYCLRMVLIYASLIKLRVQYPHLPRPFALPCNTWLAALCLLPATLFSIFAAVMSALSSTAIIIASVCFVFGGAIVSWIYCRIFARNGFQGVIVECAISDDDDENDSGPGGLGMESTRQDDLSEGVFYHEGQDEEPGDTLLGILPTAAPSPSNQPARDGSGGGHEGMNGSFRKPATVVGAARGVQHFTYTSGGADSTDRRRPVDTDDVELGVLDPAEKVSGPAFELTDSQRREGPDGGDYRP